MNDDIVSKSDVLLAAIEYADSHKANQQNASKLEIAAKLTSAIKGGNMEEKHDLKGLFIPKIDGAGPDNDISLMDVVVDNKSLPLQKFIDDLVLAVEEAQGYPKK